MAQPESNTETVQWRTSQYYGGDIAWFNGVLYRVKQLTKRKWEVSYGGNFYKQWQTFNTALSKLEAQLLCADHADAQRYAEPE